MSEKTPGLEEYKPSRLEWLEVRLNSILPLPNRHGINSFFLSGDNGRTLMLAVSYQPGVPKEDLEEYIGRAKGLAQLFIQQYGWDSWVEVKTALNPREAIEGNQTQEEE